MWEEVIWTAVWEEVIVAEMSVVLAVQVEEALVEEAMEEERLAAVRMPSEAAEMAEMAVELTEEELLAAV